MSGRATTPEAILESARRFQESQAMMSFRSIADNGIYEAIKVKSVSDNEIEFDMSLLGMGTKSYPLDDIEYIE